MADPPAERGGFILVRLWTEGDGAALRSRMTYRRDATAPGEEVSCGSSVDEICAQFRERVTAFVECARLGRGAGSR
jgi:hypothetical protein